MKYEGRHDSDCCEGLGSPKQRRTHDNQLNLFPWKGDRNDFKKKNQKFRYGTGYRNEVRNYVNCNNSRGNAGYRSMSNNSGSKGGNFRSNGVNKRFW